MASRSLFGNLAMRALTERMESVGDATRELARGQEGHVGRLDGIGRLVDGLRAGLRELHKVQDGQAIRLGRLERTVGGGGEVDHGVGIASAMAQGRNRIVQLEAEMADLKGSLVHGSAGPCGSVHRRAGAVGHRGGVG